MKLLILTQKADINDTTLGFFHSWVVEFSKHCEKVTVICLMEGKHSFPPNVKVLSLGKEKGVGRVGYVLNFFRYVFREHLSYDTVFVHMNQEYILLAGWWWRLFGKTVLMWRNHPQGNILTRIAVFFSHRVFCTSDQSYTAKFKKTRVLPAGINIEKFELENPPVRVPRSILCIGRISPIKNVDVLIRALTILDGQNITFTASIVGDVDPKDQDYYVEVYDMARELVAKNKVTFSPAVENTKTPLVYHSHEIVVNLTQTGSYDKTVLSSMISGAIVIVSNSSFEGVLSKELIFKERDAQGLAERIKGVFEMDSQHKVGIVQSLKNYVREEHGLKKTILGILEV